MPHRVLLCLALMLAWMLVPGASHPAGDSVPIRFTEQAAEAGVRASHHTRTFTGPYADALSLFTTGGAAVAIADYDNDGFDDLFVTDSAEGAPNHLFHNDNGRTFTDVAGPMGVAGGNDRTSIVSDALWFDYDNDGFRDLLVVRFGRPILYRNDRARRFIDVTSTAGFNTAANSITAIAFDYDRDGRPDVLLGNYFSAVNLFALPTTKILPTDLDNASNGGGLTLWRNVGDGHFVDVTKEAGLAGHTGWTLDVGHGDLDNDGWPDLYVASDFGTDRLFMNEHGRFKDVTKEAIGYDTKKGMNVEIADYDNDGRLDVFVTNIYDDYMRECAMLWHNNGDGTFTDLSKEAGVCETLWGWGAKFADFDNDTWLDLFVANGLRTGSAEDYLPVLIQTLARPGTDFSDLRSWPTIGTRSWSGHQRKKLHRGLGQHSFHEMAAAAGVDNDKDGRGVAIFDADNDGRMDLYQTNVNQPAIFYHNTTETVGNWVQLALTGTPMRDAFGARVTLTAGGLTQIREVNGGNGYAGQSTTRLHFGLGDATRLDDVQIRWPDGTIESVTVPINRLTRVQEHVKGTQP